MKRYDIINGHAIEHGCGKWVYYSTDVEPLEKEIEALRGSLSLAEEGLANYAQENGQLKEQVSALTIEVETARNAAKDIARETERLRSDLTAYQLERDRLRAGLLGHTCFCGPTDPDPSVHREDCPYRKWASRDPQKGDERG